MTTIRRVFESFDLNIAVHSFNDLYKELQKRRDLSDESAKAMYDGKLNPPLKEGQSVVLRTLFTIDDNYGMLESDHVVFDSADPNQFGPIELPIQKVLQALNILDITQLDKFLSIFAEVILDVEDAQEAGAEQVSSETRNVNDDSRHEAMTDDGNSSIESAHSSSLSVSLHHALSKAISPENNEPGSPSDISFSTIGRLSVRVGVTRRAGINRINTEIGKQDNAMEENKVQL